MFKREMLLITALLAACETMVQAGRLDNRPPATVQSVADQNAIRESDKLFTFGEQPDSDRRALAIIERVTANSGGDYHLQWRLARALYYVGDSTDGGAKIPHFERGIEAGRRAVSIQPNAVEGHFWLAANYGGYSEEKGAFKALQMVGKIRSEMETVLRIDDRYHHGGAYLALGEMDRQLPRIIGGNNRRAISRLEQGLKVAPRNLEMKLALAQAYREDGRKSDSEKLLREIIEGQIEPSRARSERHVQNKARKLLGR